MQLLLLSAALCRTTFLLTCCCCPCLLHVCSKEDEVIVVACPDPQGAEECIRLVRAAGEQDEREGRPYRPIVLFNPRLSRCVRVSKAAAFVS